MKKWQVRGVAGFIRKSFNTRYATYLKHKVFTEYLFNGKTALELMQNISYHLVRLYLIEFTNVIKIRLPVKKRPESEPLKIAQQVIDGVWLG